MNGASFVSQVSCTLLCAAKVLLFTSSVAYSQTPCVSDDISIFCDAQTLPCETAEGTASGICSGNKATVVELGAISLYHNSQMITDRNEGFGRNWVFLSALEIRSNDLIVLRSETGDTTFFYRSGAAFVSKNKSEGDLRTIARTLNGFEVHEPGGGREVFEQAGSDGFYYPTKFYDQAGNVNTITYHSPRSPVPATITSATGFTINFSVDEKNVRSMSTSSGLAYTFTYLDGNLSKITYPDQRSISFTYDSHGHGFITRMLDLSGKQLDATYFVNDGNRGGIVRSTKSSDGLVRFSYNKDSITTTNDSRGTVEVYTFTRARKDSPASTYLSRIETGKIGDVQPLILRHRTIRDEEGRLTSYTDSSGRETLYFYNATPSCGSSTTSGQQLPLFTCIKTDLSATLFYRDVQAPHRVLEIVSLDRNEKESRRITFSYQGENLTASVTRDSDGNIVSQRNYEYEAGSKHPKTITAEETTVLDWDFIHQRLSKLVEPTGESHVFSYDTKGELSAVTSAGITTTRTKTVAPNGKIIEEEKISGLGITVRNESDLYGSIQSSKFVRSGNTDGPIGDVAFERTVRTAAQADGAAESSNESYFSQVRKREAINSRAGSVMFDSGSSQSTNDSSSEGLAFSKSCSCKRTCKPYEGWRLECKNCSNSDCGGDGGGSEPPYSRCKANEFECGPEPQCCSEGQSCQNNKCVTDTYCDSDEVECGPNRLCCKQGQSCQNDKCVDKPRCADDETLCGDKCCYNRTHTCQSGNCVPKTAPCGLGQVYCSGECCAVDVPCVNGICSGPEEPGTEDPDTEREPTEESGSESDQEDDEDSDSEAPPAPPANPSLPTGSGPTVPAQVSPPSDPKGPDNDTPSQPPAPPVGPVEGEEIEPETDPGDPHESGGESDPDASSEEDPDSESDREQDDSESDPEQDERPDSGVSSCKLDETACGPNRICCKHGQSCQNDKCVDKTLCADDETLCGNKCCYNRTHNCQSGTCVPKTGPCGLGQTYCSGECCDHGVPCVSDICGGPEEPGTDEPDPDEERTADPESESYPEHQEDSDSEVPSAPPANPSLPNGSGPTIPAEVSPTYDPKGPDNDTPDQPPAQPEGPAEGGEIEPEPDNEAQEDGDGHEAEDPSAGDESSDDDNSSGSNEAPNPNVSVPGSNNGPAPNRPSSPDPEQSETDTSCSTDSDCPRGKSCNSNTGDCEEQEAEASHCSLDSDCFNGQSCNSATGECEDTSYHLACLAACDKRFPYSSTENNLHKENRDECKQEC